MSSQEHGCLSLSCLPARLLSRHVPTFVSGPSVPVQSEPKLHCQGAEGERAKPAWHLEHEGHLTWRRTLMR